MSATGVGDPGLANAITESAISFLIGFPPDFTWGTAARRDLRLQRFPERDLARGCHQLHGAGGELHGRRTRDAPIPGSEAAKRHVHKSTRAAWMMYGRLFLPQPHS